jgi:MipA family protein
LGAGGITINTPDYPGSNNNQFRFIPFPYVIYRGEYLRTDDEGTRARILASKRHETGLSFGLNFPVKSTNNLSRLGMPNLDALVSIGPRFLFRLISNQPHFRLNLSLATRAVFSTNFKSRFQEQGILIDPSMNFWYRFFDTKTTVFSRIGLEFGSVKYNRYFYEVPINYVTPSRSSYQAQAGLIEASLSLGMGQNLLRDDLFIFVSSSWKNLDNAINRYSPLVATKNNMSFIFGIVWTFYESESKVMAIEQEIL